MLFTEEECMAWEARFEKKFCSHCDFADEGHPIDGFYCHECSYSNGQHFIEKEDE